MSLRQAYYTSSRIGLTGQGFQFNAVSPGLPPNMLPRLAELCKYEPPPSMPPAPSEAQMETFPVNLFFQILPEKVAVIGREIYLGKGYDGRYGNFFSHLLLADSFEKDFGDLLPIELWNSPIWQRQCVETTELPLPQAPVRRFEILDPDALDSFARGERREEYLPGFFAALEAAFITGRRIVLVERSSDLVARWIALASLCLPRSLARQFSFCTYHKDPDRCGALLIGTTEDSRFPFSPQQMRFQYFVLDFVRQRFSAPPSQTPFSSALLAAWNAGGSRGLCRLGRDLDSMASHAKADALPQLSLLASVVSNNGGDAVDPVALLGLCAQLTPEQWPNRQRLPEVFWQAAHGRAGDERVGLAAAEARQFVGAHFDPHDETAKAFHSAFDAWVVTEVCAHASATVLKACASVQPAKATPRPELPRQDWIAAIRDAVGRDSARCLALLQVGEAYGWLAMADFPTNALVENIVWLGSDPAMRDCLNSGARSGVQSVLLTALAEGLAAQPAEVPTLKIYDEAIPQAPIAEMLSRYAREHAIFSLACRMRARIQPPGTRRTDTLKACLNFVPTMRKGRELPGQDSPFDFAYRIIWGNAPLPLDEAVQVVTLACDHSEGAVSASSQCSPALAAANQALLTSLRLPQAQRGLDAKQQDEKLAALLEKVGSSVPVSKALALRRELASLPLVRSRDSSPVTAILPSDIKLAASIEDCLGIRLENKLPNGLGEELLDLGARALAGVESHETQYHILNIVVSAPAALGQCFLTSYRTYTLEALKTNPAPVSLAAALFTAWQLLAAPPMRDAGPRFLPGWLRSRWPTPERRKGLERRKWASLLLKGSLSRALLHWNPRLRSAIREQLQADSLYQVKWDRWVIDNCPSGIRKFCLLGLDLLRNRRRLAPGSGRNSRRKANEKGGLS